MVFFPYYQGKRQACEKHILKRLYLPEPCHLACWEQDSRPGHVYTAIRNTRQLHELKDPTSMRLHNCLKYLKDPRLNQLIPRKPELLSRKASLLLFWHQYLERKSPSNKNNRYVDANSDSVSIYFNPAASFRPTNVSESEEDLSLWRYIPESTHRTCNQRTTWHFDTQLLWEHLCHCVCTPHQHRKVFYSNRTFQEKKRSWSLGILFV